MLDINVRLEQQTEKVFSVVDEEVNNIKDNRRHLWIINSDVTCLITNNFKGFIDITEINIKLNFAKQGIQIIEKIKSKWKGVINNTTNKENKKEISITLNNLLFVLEI